MKVLLVDANNLAYRNFYAQNLKTSNGQNTGMIYGFLNSMLTAIRDLDPDIIHYVWDPEGGSEYRKKIYNLYKGNRDSKGPEFFEEMDLLKQILDSIGSSQITKPKVEADDVIGYLAVEHYKEHISFIYSNDKDVLQLISSNVLVYQPHKGLIALGVDGKIAIKDQSKTIMLEPKQVVDYKALVGDPSDNYPGIPGFGIGAAIKYFELNKSAEGIVEGTALLSNQRSNVLSAIIEHRGMVPIWLKLAKINFTEGEVSITAKCQPNKVLVNAIFEQLEFKQFLALGDIIYRIGGK